MSSQYLGRVREVRVIHADGSEGMTKLKTVGVAKEGRKPDSDPPAPVPVPVPVDPEEPTEGAAVDPPVAFDDGPTAVELEPTEEVQPA